MASVKAAEIQEEQKMWTELWEFRKEFYHPEDNAEYWKKTTDRVKEIGEKYKTDLCRKWLFAILDELNE